MDEVFIVTTGTYSDFCMVAAFTTEEEAEALAKTIQDGGDVVRMELDRDTNDWWQVCVIMHRDGRVMRADSPFKDQHGPVRQSARLQSRFDEEAQETRAHLFHTSPGTDVQGAIKAANEIRTQLATLHIWDRDMSHYMDIIEANQKLVTWMQGQPRERK